MEKPTWQERARLVAEEHKKLTIEALERNESWSIAQTAEKLHRSNGSVCQDMLISSWSKVYPKILDFRTSNEAIIFIRDKKKELKLR